MWNGENWLEKFPAASPPLGGAMAYDGAAKKVLLFGGQETGAELQTSDTWEWDGGTWENKAAAIHPDVTLGGFYAAYDAASRSASVRAILRRESVVGRPCHLDMETIGNSCFQRAALRLADPWLMLHSTAKYCC